MAGLRILKNKAFHLWMKSVGINDAALITAVQEISQGLCEAKLGGGIYKKRIALNNQGKSGGARSIIAYKAGSLVVFIYGFSKSKQDNITAKELAALKQIARLYFSYNEQEIERAIHHHELWEVTKK